MIWMIASSAGALANVTVLVANVKSVPAVLAVPFTVMECVICPCNEFPITEIPFDPAIAITVAESLLLLVIEFPLTHPVVQVCTIIA